MGWFVALWASSMLFWAVKLNSPSGMILAVVLAALTVPPLWAKLKKKGFNTRPGLRWSAATAVGFIGLLVMGTAYSHTPEGKAAAAKREAERKAVQAQLANADRDKEQKEAADIASGEHCMSGWDGSLKGLKDAVKNNLRNPRSFEHVETVRSPVDSKGTFAVIMTYRAENGFGGMNVEAIGVEVEAKNCNFRQVSEKALAKRLKNRT